jgi:voltage-gated potassium channel
MSEITYERKKLLRRIESFLEWPMVVLGFVWLMLLVLELVYGENKLLENFGLIIWVIFIVDFIIKFSLAPVKGPFVKSNILTIISLVVPAFRVFRIFRIIRVFRISRSFRLVKIIGSLNRGMRALSITMQRRAFGYVLLLTLIVIFAGAAGMFAFEKDTPEGLKNYGTSLWWTTMIITTLGSEFWPQTLEGRILCIILSLFGFAVFGYITATIATFFIGRDAEENKATTELAKIDELRSEIIELKAMIKALKT